MQLLFQQLVQPIQASESAISHCRGTWSIIMISIHLVILFYIEIWKNDRPQFYLCVVSRTLGLLFILAIGSSDSCAEFNVDYFGNDAGSILNIASWEACAQECATRSTCYAWSWVTNDSPFQHIRGKCHFKNINWESDRRVMEHIISGKRTCLGPIRKGFSFIIYL